jgi:cytochrome c
MRVPLYTALAGIALAASARGGTTEPGARDAIAMAERAAAVVKAHGKQTMIAKINARHADVLRGSLYVDMRDLNTGVVLAHPVNPTLVGKDLLDVPDPSGKQYRREIIALARSRGKGWLDYRYRNPTNGKVEPKTTYILRVDDIVLEAGFYRK